MILYQIEAPWRFLATLTKFDLKSILGGSKNPDFDTATEMGWNQCHCEYYSIPVPKIIHGSKSELKWLRYWENHEKRISRLPKVITFDLTVGFLISLALWKLEIHRFPETPISPQSKSGKTSKYVFEVRTCKVYEDEIVDISGAWPDSPCMASDLTRRPLKGNRASGSIPRAINRPWHPRLDENRKRGVFGSCFARFWSFSLFLFSPYFSPKNTKTHQNFLILLLSQKIKGSVHTLHPSLFGSIPWIWGLRGMDVAF